MALFDNVTEQSTSQELFDILKAGFDEVSTVDHNTILAPALRKQFCDWRQKMGSLLTWYARFVQYKDYGAGVNAAMALGKFGEVESPAPNLVSVDVLQNLDVLCGAIWTDIKRGKNAD